MKRSVLIWFALLLATLRLPAATPTGPELLPNPGFEEAAPTGAVGWTALAPRDWGDCAGTARRVTGDPHGGQACAELAGVRVRYALAAPSLPVQPGAAYLLSGWVRCALGAGESAYLAASWSSDQGFLQLTQTKRLTGRQPWTRLELVIPPERRPADATRVLVTFRVDSGTGQGTAWADDLSLRTCDVPPPPPRVSQESARQHDLARSLLLEKLWYEARLAALRRQRADLEALLAGPDDAAALASRFADPAFLRRSSPSRRELEAGLPADEAGLRARLGELAALPGLRDAALAEQDALLTLKRRLDAHPAQRRYYLQRQVRGLRPQRITAPTAGPLAAGGAAPRTELGQVDCRTGYTGAGWLRATVPVPAAQAGDQVAASLLDHARRPVATATATPANGQARIDLTGLGVHAWFPDYPYRYTLRVALLRGGQTADWADQPVAFRDLRVLESDVSATMRHAWGWAPADYTFSVNGQPWFPRGTVLNDWRRYPAESAALFGELWLEFQRTYGNSLGSQGSDAGRLFREAGLLFLGSTQPDYNAIRTYVSRRQGLEEYREEVRQDAGLLGDPALMVLQVGNEEELAVWGADLPSVYGRDLWQIFDDVIGAVRDETTVPVPVSYVRAGHHRSVAPVPGEDYSGINQYAGRYWGSRRTVRADLSHLALAATAAGKPFGVTEWNGPKYSWATSGVSGIDEEGAASYITDYWRDLLRTPTAILSTEFVLNWVVTPVEDLTTLPLEEGLKRRAAWHWNLQQGTPWYPSVFPDLLTDTPARRAMQGFQSPLYELLETPGRLAVAGAASRRETAQELAAALRGMGRDAETIVALGREDVATLDASLLVLGGVGDQQPELVRRFEREGTIGATTADFPGPGRFLIQRRVNPFWPDRFLVVVTAGDEAGFQQAVAKLRRSAAGLTEACARRSSARRLLALHDPGDRANLDRYLTDVAARGWFVARDDLRTRLDPAELVAPDGRLQPAFGDLQLLLVTVKRALEPGELTALRAAARAGVEVVWSAATLDANPALATALGVTLGAPHSLTGSVPVAEWAQRPLTVTDLGHVVAAKLQQFGRIDPASARGQAALTLRELTTTGPWRVAATADGRPVVARRAADPGGEWVFGGDLATILGALISTTRGGVNHGIYDRDTACGLERVCRLVINAGAHRVTPRPAERPRLRCDLELPASTLASGQPLTVTCRVRDAAGEPADATVRVGLTTTAGSNYGAPPETWLTAARVAPGRYQVTVPAADLPAAQAGSYLGYRQLGLYATAEALGAVGDWTCGTVRVGNDSDEPARLADLVGLVQQRQVRLPLNVSDEEQYVEFEGWLLLPQHITAGRPLTLELAFTQVERDEGNDYLEEATLVLQPAQGPAVELPLAPGKVITSNSSRIIRQRPQDMIIVDSQHPAHFKLTLENPQPGPYRLGLRHRYTDEYRPAIARIPRMEWWPGATFTVEEAGR